MEKHLYLGLLFKYFSIAIVIEGTPGNGALMSILRPAFSAACTVVCPKAAIFVPFCLNFGKA